MPELDTPAARAVLQQMVAESAARIKAADAKAHEAMSAFAAGKFGEFYRDEYEASQKAMHDEHQRTMEQITDPGDGEAGG